MHHCRYGLVKPATNADFWAAKRQSNASRDRKNIVALRRAGWSVMTVWECQTKDVLAVATRATNFLGST
jgi:DNA mismatch endonuclease, patch repair protein